MMAEKFSEELVEEFQASLHRPLTDEETMFLYWVGEENARRLITNAAKNSIVRAETFA